ncbi:AAC(3)-I family aminoglycoside N-acetyltransferase [Paracoccus pacificus]|uniref:AAC(3)-I family aminoglycoside N-acetyltransferase n=1 Tax=Paracoccus pacificus TaxID=1463598 RepID=A0ABW4RDE9_9RHOB
MSQSIRKLGPADIAQMRAVNAMFAEAFGDPQTYLESPPDDVWLGDLLAGDQVIVLAAVDAGRVVGGLVAYDLPKLEQRRREIYIYDLAVAATHRRRGIATALIDALRPIARARGAWVMYVQADPPDAAAVALYERLGIREDVCHFDIAPDDSPDDPLQASSSTHTGT